MIVIFSLTLLYDYNLKYGEEVLTESKCST